MSNGLMITRAIAVRAIRHKRPNEPMIVGIPKLILLSFDTVHWVEYLPKIELWNLDFCDVDSLLLFKLRYF